MSQAHAVQRSDEVKEPADAQQGGRKAIIAAVFANLAIAVTKAIAWALTGASSMLAEAIHSVADSGNQILLLVGGKRARKDADEFHPFVLNEFCERPDCIGTASDTGDDYIRQAASALKHLLLSFFGNDPMELPDDSRERVWPSRSAEEIVGFMERSGPIVERFIHRVLKRSGPGINGYDFRVH